MFVLISSFYHVSACNSSSPRTLDSNSGNSGLQHVWVAQSSRIIPLEDIA